MVKWTVKMKNNTDSDKYIKSESQTYTDKSYYYKMVNIKSQNIKIPLTYFHDGPLHHKTQNGL